jgi:hypothetical protein
LLFIYSKIFHIKQKRGRRTETSKFKRGSSVLSFLLTIGPTWCIRSSSLPCMRTDPYSMKLSYRRLKTIQRDQRYHSTLSDNVIIFPLSRSLLHSAEEHRASCSILKPKATQNCYSFETPLSCIAVEIVGCKQIGFRHTRPQKHVSSPIPSPVPHFCLSPRLILHCKHIDTLASWMPLPLPNSIIDNSNLSFRRPNKLFNNVNLFDLIRHDVDHLGHSL